MNRKNNKRAQNSIQKIKKSASILIKNINHKKMTIKDICNKAKINRATFYAHFDSIESVLYEICEEYIINCYKIFLDKNLSYKTRIRNAIELIQEDLDFFAYIFDNVHNLELKILEMVENYYTDDDFVSGTKAARLSLAFIISGFVGVGKIYFNSEKYKMKPEEFADILYSAINVSNPYFTIK